MWSFDRGIEGTHTHTNRAGMRRIKLYIYTHTNTHTNRAGRRRIQPLNLRYPPN